MIDGVGLLKIGTTITDVEEFYVVIFDDELHPQKFKSYAEALRFRAIALRIMGIPETREDQWESR